MRVWCPNVVERNSCLSLFAFPTISSSSISFLVLRLYSYQPLFFSSGLLAVHLESAGAFIPPLAVQVHAPCRFTCRPHPSHPTVATMLCSHPHFVMLIFWTRGSSLGLT